LEAGETIRNSACCLSWRRICRSTLEVRMFRKTALLTAAALLAVSAAPALARDAVQSRPDASPAAPAQGSLTLQPGAEVKGSDGAVLGKLEGVITVANAQHLTVRGADGVVKAVPLSGLKPEGAGVAVGMTSAEFQAAAAVQAGTTPPVSAEPAPSEPAPAEPDQAEPDQAPPASSPRA
jgi:hypothetical protein